MIKKILTFFSLFGSLSTLLCCALPVTLVTLGMGATFASLTSSFPQIIWLTERKDILFVITGLMLISSYFLLKKSEKLECPIDPIQAKACKTSKGISFRLFWFSTIIFFIGLIFSYVLPFVLY